MYSQFFQLCYEFATRGGVQGDNAERTVILDTHLLDNNYIILL